MSQLLPELRPAQSQALCSVKVLSASLWAWWVVGQARNVLVPFGPGDGVASDGANVAGDVAGVSSPYAHCSVGAAGGECVPVGAERYPVYDVGGAGQDGAGVWLQGVGQVPQPYGVVEVA